MQRAVACGVEMRRWLTNYNAWNIVHPAWPRAEYFIKQLEVD
jgi:hypothetical protein